MNIKYKKLLFVAAITNLLLGLFLFVCSILEFTGIIQTQAHNVTETIGVHVSYLVFLSAILIALSGLLTVIFNKTLAYLNTQILVGVVSLAWPLFLSISLFFTQLTINIRLLATVAVSLFYVISILIVKISNDEFVKNFKFNPSSLISSMGKRTQSVDLTNVFNQNIGKAKRANLVQSMGNLAVNVKPKHTLNFGLNFLNSGRRRSGFGLGRRLYSGQKRRSANIIASLFRGRRRPRRRF